MALDWTEFDRDDHSTIALNMITRYGRATPLVWKSVKKSRLKGQRKRYEELIPNMLAERLRPLMERFSEVLNEQRVFTGVFGIL